MFRQSIAFTPPVHGSDAPPPPQQQSQQQQPSVGNVSESSRRQQIAAASSSPVKSHPLHNFPLSDLRWAMNHANTHRLRKPSGRSPLREATNHSKGAEEVNEASGSSSFELRPEKQKKKEVVVSDSAADRSGTKSTAADCRSKIFIRIRTKNNEETAEAAATAVSDIAAATAVADVHESDDADAADVSIGERISDGGGGGGQEGDEFGPKTWNLRPRKPPTKKRSIGGNSGGTLLTENKAQGTVRTEAIRSRNGVDAKIATTTTTERKEKKPRLSISLSKMEIDEDIYSLTGSKPSRRPKKRAKNVQKQLDVLFPGLWMGNVSSDAYKVSEHA
ncbi:hypothetical protein HA466_0170970 [Hirschfeldia incana]|nr:hypothetical protein HA466_0170970 [Hirschfeldia incana]